MCFFFYIEIRFNQLSKHIRGVFRRCFASKFTLPVNWIRTMAYCVTGGWTRVHWIWCTVEWTWFVENFWCTEVIEPPYLVCNDLFFSELHILFRRSCVHWVVRVWPLHWSPKWARKNEPLHAVFACFALFLFHRFGEIHSICRNITEGFFFTDSVSTFA